MAEQQHPVTPPSNLRRLWAQEAQRMDPHDPVAWLEHVAAQAARWGADAELEACCEVLAERSFVGQATILREWRRPKPPSLAEQALDTLETKKLLCFDHPEGYNIIRRALKRLQELEQANG